MKVNARIKLHTLTTDTDFIPATTEVIKDLTPEMLLMSEIGLNTFREKAYVNLNGNIKELIHNPSKEWVLQFVNTNDVVLVYATAGNIVTFNSGLGADVGSIEVSTNGISYSALTFPFTPVAGYYWFKRSTSLVTGEYIISE